MKPIVIYLDKRDNEVRLTRKEFEDYLNKAYDQGYNCGLADGRKNYWWWPTYYTTTATDTGHVGNWTPDITTAPNTPLTPDWYKITCTGQGKDIDLHTNNSTTGEAHNAIGD